MKVAVVTGGTRGIGRGIAECLARDGYSLVLGYNSNLERAERARDSIEKEHDVTVKLVGGDIADLQAVDALFACAQALAASSSSGDEPVLAYVHNAGLLPSVAAKHLGCSTTSWDPRLYDYFSKVYCHSFRRALNLARAWPGFKHAVAISALGCNSTQNPPGFFYEAPGQAKAGLEYLVRVFAKQLAKEGVTINAVIPGSVETEAWDGLVEQTGMDLTKYIESTPAGRWASPADIGEAVAFLCSPRAAFINGVALPIDGGHHLGPLGPS